MGSRTDEAGVFPRACSQAAPVGAPRISGRCAQEACRTPLPGDGSREGGRLPATAFFLRGEGRLRSVEAGSPRSAGRRPPRERCCPRTEIPAHPPRWPARTPPEPRRWVGAKRAHLLFLPLSWDCPATATASGETMLGNEQSLRFSGPPCARGPCLGPHGWTPVLAAALSVTRRATACGGRPGAGSPGGRPPETPACPAAASPAAAVRGGRIQRPVPCSERHSRARSLASCFRGGRLTGSTSASTRSAPPRDQRHTKG